MVKIPKIAHFIWSNKHGLPFSRLLSIATFSCLNPNFKIYYHTFDNTAGNTDNQLRGGETVCRIGFTDCASQLRDIPNLEIIHHTDLHGTLPDQLPTFLSDILRYHLLGTIGGFYFDTDILFFKSMNESYLFNGMYTDTTAIISHSKKFGRYGAYRIGVLASQRNSRLFRDVYDVARWQLDPLEYQSSGAEALQAILGGPQLYRNFDVSYPDEIIHNLLDSFSYKYNFEALKLVFPLNTLEYLKNSFNSWCVSVHWYGGVLSESIDKDLQIENLQDSKRFVDFLFYLAIELVKNHIKM